MKPLPWSYSSLSTFVSCPRLYHEKNVLKSVKDVPGAAAAHGDWVHKQFESFIKSEATAKMEPGLEVHVPYLTKLATTYGKKSVELKWGLNRQLEPVSFFAEDVWARGIIDYQRVYHTKDQNGKLFEALKMVDHKTGKKKNVDGKQLKLFALYGFQTGAKLVDTEYYWTQDIEHPTRQVYTIDQRDELWQVFLPDLKQYAEAFKRDIWQPRPNGLCKGWCPVTQCEHWQEKRA